MPYKLDFKEIAERIDVGTVAKHFGLAIQKDRAACPICAAERALQIFPETNSYRCHSAEVSGDCISLYAHIKRVGMYAAAKALSELFPAATASGIPATPPQKSEGRTARAQPAPKIFDPEEYASKLQYTAEIEALGISQDDAARLGIGFASTGLHRGSIVIAVRNSDGTVAGFAGIKGEVKLPNKWLEPKVVPLRKRA